MAVGDVDGDVFGADAVGHETVHRLVVRLLHTQRDGGKQSLGLHVLGEGHVVDVKTVHHIEETVLCQIGADLLVHHRLHVGGHHRQLEAAAAQHDTGVTFRTAFHAAHAGQQKNVVVVEDFHGSKLRKRSRRESHPPQFSRIGAWLGARFLAVPACSRQKKPDLKKLGPGD
ncbi:hypothetical protein SDC9_151933 [bioreactor metagenome]|uniref:Uncharacterized protein n=1 Tax=bioreactor metagenome TaxID=1076179 RepID=A0A645ERM8_9ZZZZ